MSKYIIDLRVFGSHPIVSAFIAVPLKEFIHAFRKLIPFGISLFAFGMPSFAQNAQVEWKETAVTFDESAGTVQVTLVRSGNLTSLATVFYSTFAETATSSFDYQAVTNRQAIFTSGTEEVDINISISQDFQEEGNETFLVQLSNPNLGTDLGNNKDIRITIQDDDVPLVEWADAIVRVGEDSTTVDLTAIRSGGTNSSVSLTYSTTAGTATALQDFQTKTGTISFPSGVTQQTVSININNDTLTETDEEFTVTLGNLSSGNIGPQNPVRVIIEDDESAPGEIGWHVSSVTQLESETEIELVAQRTGGTQGSVSVQYSTSAGTATSGVDYSATSGLLTWGTGSNTPRTVTVTILDDAMDEPDETFTLALSNLIGSATLGTSIATITIQDDDEENSAGTIAFVQNSTTVDESVGSVIVSVARSGGAAGELSVDYSFVDSSATNGADYSGVNGTLSWEDGDTDNKIIQVPILEDGSADSGETFFITLSAEEASILGEQVTFTVQVEDDDVETPGVITFVGNGQTVSEGVGQVSILAQRLGGSTGEVSVNYETEEGTALAGLDYLVSLGTLTWSDGDSSEKEIIVSIVDDQLFEGSESLTVRISDVPGGNVAGANSVHLLTIDDDEPEPATWFEFSRTLYSGTESAGQVLIEVERFGGGAGAASVFVQSEDGTAFAGLDYATLNQQLDWADGETGPKTATLVVVDDAFVEQSEQVNLLLINPSENSLVGDLSDATALIYDDDGVTGELVNLSTRGYVGLGNDVLVGGFIVFNGSQRFLIRAVGPSLTGVDGAIEDPVLQIIDNSDQSLVVENDNWTDDTSQIQPILDTGLGGLNLFESAVLVTLPPGSYSAIVASNGDPGTASIEIYVDASAGLTGDLVNLSTRGRVASGDDVMIGGLIIGGVESKRLLFRGMGPSLIIPGSPSLNDPELLLFDAGGQLLDSNDNWMTATNWDEIEATQLVPMDNEAAMLLDLDPGSYTIHLRSVNEQSGVGLVEIYSLN